MPQIRNRLTVLAAILMSAFNPRPVNDVLAAELVRITESNFADVVPAGKEVDAIYGDYVLRNDRVVAVLAQPIANRKANMTTRGVGGMLIDFTSRYYGSDQLSCFYPGAGRYLFEQSDAVTVTLDGQELDATNPSTFQQPLVGKSLSISFRGSPVAPDGSRATVTYSLTDDAQWLDYSMTLTNSSQTAMALPVEDSLRCDGNLFVNKADSELQMFYANDIYFGQCYGFVYDSLAITSDGSGRSLILKPTASEVPEVGVGEDRTWSGKVYCSQGLPGALSWASSLKSGQPMQTMELKLQGPQGPVPHARVEFIRNGQPLGEMLSSAEGMIRTELLDGDYQLSIRAIGVETRQHEFKIEGSKHADTLSLPAASRVRGNIVDGESRPIAAKIQFIGMDESTDPDFGPDSGSTAIKNVVYCALGKFEQPIDPGKYRVIISHGPEYDAQTIEIQVAAGQLVPIKSMLPRTVDTTGWISSDFHSHSSPSGDNVSDQRGRVLNLLAEHIEFAPCTEHNRIDTYQDDLEALRATTAMATCTGMELTGSPLPINHQNAFPMHRHEHEQDGGGPQSDADPVKQIERLALWDNSSSKVVQTNHPNIPQILGDVDLDGSPDAGFRGMLGWMDVIEVHPPAGIFAPPQASIAAKDKNQNPIFFWMQLLNLGYRITGVVNTDAHYNFHGSGWLRNYLECPTDEPSQISIDDMIHSSEHGHLLMTSGPFLQTEIRLGQAETAQSFTCGDDVVIGEETGKLWIRVQCPNWFDVNRVQVFANGRALEGFNFTRKSHPQMFSTQPVRFEELFELPKFAQDTHLIVATIGEGLQLGPVMGVEQGQLPPVAVANPIFLDIDGGGFKANGDDLGVPFMLPQFPK